MTRECISRILELRKTLLSIKTGFSLVNAAVVCAILESISGLEPSSVMNEPRYLKLVNVDVTSKAEIGDCSASNVDSVFVIF